MQDTRPINLIDIDILIKNFFKERDQSINTLHRIYFKNNNQTSLRALKEELIDELRTAGVSFINKNAPLEEINTYLFYVANAFCKKISIPAAAKQQAEYICPGCVFLGKEYFALVFNKVFKCDECEFELKKTSDPKRISFFSTFAVHNKHGYHCPDCQRFIPHPMDNSSQISCPYFDCYFVGVIGDMHKMHHPTSKSNPEKLILDTSQDGGFCLKDNVPSHEADACTQLEIAEDLRDKLKILQEIIEAQSNNVPYCSADATIKHKQFVYQAFSNLLKEFPTEMTEYLLDNSNNHVGFQHKVFQEYIRLLESSLPLFFTKNKKLHKVESLLDDSLCLFDGISVFDSVISEKLTIKNGTKEFYIGGRKAAYTKPFYIGKLLSIINRDTKNSLMHLVKDYSFSKIHMRDIEPNTPVTVTHLRVPPHYQMGGMAYVNRIRKKIVERAKMTIQ